MLPGLALNRDANPSAVDDISQYSQDPQQSIGRQYQSILIRSAIIQVSPLSRSLSIHGTSRPSRAAAAPFSPLPLLLGLPQFETYSNQRAIFNGM